MIQVSETEDIDNDDDDDNVSLYSSGSADLPLYNGSSVTVLQSLAGYFAWFTEFPAVSKSALSSMLALNKNLMPSPNNLPASYEEAMKFMKPFLLPLVVYDVCLNDCIVYRKTERYDYSKLESCPVCGAKRYSSDRKPVRKFEYYPLIPRWKRMYGSATIAEVLQSHANSTRSHDHMKDVHDSPSWEHAYSDSGFSGGDPRALLLQFSSDGVNPFSSNKVSYSMWPIMITNLNLPRHIRSFFGNLMLVSIIPAQCGGSEPKSLDPYLEIVVDELLSLTGITFYDALKKESFIFKATFLNYVLDYPGCAKVFNSAGPTALQACMWCDLRGCYVQLLDKVVFLDNRRFLPENHDLRHQTVKEFPSGNAELRSPPEKLTNDEIIINSLAHSKAKNKTQAANVMKATGSKGVNCFMLLPDNDRPNQCYPDVMHNLKNVIVNFFDLIIGRGYNTKDKDFEVQLGRFRGSFAEKDGANKQSQGLPFLLSKAELKLADERVKKSISMHILHHVVAGIKVHGPVHSWWMYVYERFNSWICQRVKNRRHPEVNVMETYRVNN
ncbi:hypothetical protein QZH41_010032 [Actinostola sp. cb2023]|nr:hypothetical protein QZH41_010032 [Actinostola sp. cb2023]